MQASGFVFVELFVENLAHYVALFRDVLGFTLTEDDGDFVKLRSPQGLVLLNASADLPPDHPFATVRGETKRGLGVEIVIVTEDLPGAWKRAKKLEGCTVSAVVAQEWGASDFRILSREGYFFRVSTPQEG
jgi:hypothetical protein